MKIVYLVSVHIIPDADSDLLLTYAERIFSTEDKANEYAHRLNQNSEGVVEYICPAEGTKEWHQYFVEPIVMEEV